MIVIKNSTCMVRVGGGFERLEEYIAKHHDEEMEKIKRLMKNQNKSYSEIVTDLLVKYQAPEAIIKQVQASFKQAISAKLKAIHQKQQQTSSQQLTNATEEAKNE